jgi:sulfopyruvate decarboxylase subunit beta
MNKKEAIKSILSSLDKEIVVTNIGEISKLVYELNDRSNNFYMMGSMGLATSIALGLALSTDEKVICLEGDGSLLMNLGSLATIGSLSPDNLIIVVLDDKSYNTTGGQQVLKQYNYSFSKIAETCGLESIFCKSLYNLTKNFEHCLNSKKSTLLHILLTTSKFQTENINLKPVDISNRFIRSKSNNGINF